MSALASTVTRLLPQTIPPATPRPRPAAVGSDYQAVFGPGGLVEQAKECFIAARFSPSQPLRIKRTFGLRALQSVFLPEPSEIFSIVIPWDHERLAA